MNFNIRHKLNEGYSIGGIADAYHSPRNERLEGSYVSKSNGSSIIARVMASLYLRNERLEGSYVSKSNGSSIIARVMASLYLRMNV